MRPFRAGLHRKVLPILGTCAHPEQVRTFLLERSRVTSCINANERAYHVLYQVISGKSHTDALPVESFRYLSFSGCTTIDGVDDAKEFADLNKAMISVGMDAQEVRAQCHAQVDSHLYGHRVVLVRLAPCGGSECQHSALATLHL